MGGKRQQSFPAQSVVQFKSNREKSVEWFFFFIDYFWVMRRAELLPLVLKNIFRK